MSQNISVKLFTGTVITHEYLFPKNPGGRTKYPVKMHQCSGARKNKNFRQCMWPREGVYMIHKDFLFHSLFLSISLLCPLCLLLPHAGCVGLYQLLFFFFFNYTYFLFKYSVLFPTFFSLFTHCIFFHSCVSNIVAEFIPIISLICLQRKGGFSKELSAQDTFLNPGT